MHTSLMHHAEVLIGTYDWALEYLPVTLLKQSPDVRHLRYERMGIHDAQALIVEAQLRPVMAEKRSFLLYAEVLPQETQNALLKLFEDPPASSHFVLVIPHESILLPTLKSRLHVRAVESSENEAFYTKTFQDFCTATYAGLASKIMHASLVLQRALVQHLGFCLLLRRQVVQKK